MKTTVLLFEVLVSFGAMAQGIQCMGNNRQLGVAWHVYANDFNGKVALKGGIAD